MRLIIPFLFVFIYETTFAAAPPSHWATCVAQGYDENSSSLVLVEGSAMNEVIASENALYFCHELDLLDCEVIECKSEEFTSGAGN